MGGVAHDPKSTRMWLEKLNRWKEIREEATVDASEWRVRQMYHDLARSPKFLAAVEKYPETAVAVLPVFSVLLWHTLLDVYKGREPSVRALLVGEGGVGKTTIGFYLVAVAWGMANGLCRGDLGTVHIDIDAPEPPFADWIEPPLVDCRLEHNSDEPPEEWRWLLDAVVFTVEDLAEALLEYVGSIERGVPPTNWAFLFDEVGSSNMSSSEFFLRRHRYAAASALVPLLRTATPFMVATTTSVSRVGRALREYVNYVLYMQTLSPKGDYARDELRRKRFLRTSPFKPADIVAVRMDTSVPAFGPAERVKHRKLQGRSYFVKGSIKMPRWYYKENIKFRKAVVEAVLDTLRKKEKREEDEEWS